MAVRRCPYTRGETVFHSGRGCQYTSEQLGDHLESYGTRPSVGRTGVCWAGAWAEVGGCDSQGTRGSIRWSTTARRKAIRDTASWIELEHTIRNDSTPPWGTGRRARSTRSTEKQDKQPETPLSELSETRPAAHPQHLPHRVLADAELLGCALDGPDRLVGLTNPLAEGLVLEADPQRQARPLQVGGHRFAVEAELLGDLLDRTAAAMQLVGLPLADRPAISLTVQPLRCSWTISSTTSGLRRRLMRRGAGPEGLSAPSEDVVALASAWRTALASPRIERRAAPPAVSPSGGRSPPATSCCCTCWSCRTSSGTCCIT